MSTNAEETAAQAGVVSAASEQVSRNVQTVATGTEEMSASIREIAKNANEAARVAKNAVHAANITIKGSDTMVILAQRWAETYMKQHPEVTIQVTGGGSGTGIAALINKIYATPKAIIDRVSNLIK